jgi:MFS family permease
MSAAAFIAPVIPVLVGVVFLELAVGALGPVAGVQLVARNASAGLVGLVASAHYAGFLAGALTAHRAIDRVGHVRAFSALAVVAATATLLHGLIDPPIAWAAFRFSIGWALAGLFVVAESWLNDKATAVTRGRTFATYMVVSWAASGVGPLVLTVGNPLDHRYFIAIGIAFALAVLPMALTTVGNPEVEQRAHFGIVRLFRVSPLGVAACFGAGLVGSAFYGMAPVYVEAIGLDAKHLSVLLSTAIIGALVVQFPIGWLADRLGRRPLMLACGLAAAGLAVAIAWTGGRSFESLLALVFLFGSATAPFYALGVGQTNDYITQREFVAASGGLLFAWGLGASAGPSAAALVMSWAGAPGLFVYLAVVLGAISLFTIYRMYRRRAFPAAQQGNFLPIEPATCAPGLDPRSAQRPETARASA